MMKTGLKGAFLAAFNAGMFILITIVLFKCDVGPFISKILYFGVFIVPLMVIIYFTFKMMMSLEEKNTGNLIFCLVLGPNLMVIPSVILWMIFGLPINECLAS